MADSWGRRVSKGCPHETLVPLGWRACGHTRGGQMGSTAAVELSPTQWHRSLFGVLYSAQVFTHRPQRTSLLPGATGSGAPLPSPALALVSVVLAEDPVVLQVEGVAHTEPVLALSTRKALQVVDIGAGPHDHLCRVFSGIIESTTDLFEGHLATNLCPLYFHVYVQSRVDSLQQSRRQESLGRRQHRFQGSRTVCGWRKGQQSVAVSSTVPRETLTSGSLVCRAAGRPLCTEWRPPPPGDSHSSRTSDSPRATTHPEPSRGTAPRSISHSPHTGAPPPWSCSLLIQSLGETLLGHSVLGPLVHPPSPYSLSVLVSIP
jgi:hypothetical protein